MESNIRKNDNQDFFDREYGLADLLEKGILDELFGEAQKTVTADFHILSRNGDIFYSRGSIDHDEKELCRKSLGKVKTDRPGGLKGKKRSIIIFTIIHELEKTGYMVLLYHKGTGDPQDRYLTIGSLLSKIISQYMRLQYRYLMTADLHGQVVEESYADLRHKAVKLEESEGKYKRLAESLEKEVEKQTEKIKKAQTRLFQQEKLAAVGRLAAGVAHEINNPVGFVKSNLGTIDEYISDIRTYVEAVGHLETLYNNPGNQPMDMTELSHVFKKIADVRKQIDLDFIMNDFSGVISESKEGAGRIGKIVSNLKEFSSIDNPGKTFTDINECIENTVNIMASALQARVDIVKDLGEIPKIPCHRDKINQVFLNVLFNASDAAGSNGKIYIKTSAGEEEKAVR